MISLNKFNHINQVQMEPTKQQSYDLIGDIHGHATELKLLLTKLGYLHNETFYYHKEGRMAIFVGDLVDRGPEIREVLQIVRSMVENDTALCIKGNHEYNAINFWLNPPKREHKIQNIIQHFATIKAFQNRESELKDYLKWFETLPNYLDLPQLRVIHATWDDRILTDQSEEIIELCLKGKEYNLPEGISFADKDGKVRTKSRIKWWKNPNGLTLDQYLEEYVADQPNVQGVPVSLPNIEQCTGYDITEKPVFFGHYWLRGKPRVQADNVCCLDYSVAKGGELLAYRFDGESILSSSKFVTIPASTS